jgi:nickel/cobalt exporter
MRRLPARAVPALLMLATALLALAAPGRASAHPLGNFTVNQYARVEVSANGPRIVYVLDMAEIPTFQALQSIDTNSDGTVDDAEKSAYLTTLLPEIADGLKFTLDGDRMTLRAQDGADLQFPDGQAGLKLLRLRATFAPLAPHLLTSANQQITLSDEYETGRIGWREMLVTYDAGITISGITAPATDTSRELTSYPSDLLSSPLDQTSLAFGVQVTPGTPAAPGYAAFATGAIPQPSAAAARPNGGSTGGHFAALLNGDKLTTTGLIVTLLLAMVWGAAHALSPGHGKTVVGAYLVGSRGTPRHAVFLGLTVTITHTAGVIALGLLTLFASHYIMPETLFPWLSVSSGVLVVLMGLWTLQMRLRGEPAFGHHHQEHAHDEHDHPHVHEHDHEHVHIHDGLTHSHGGHTHSHLPPGEISWRSLLALGVSGGMIPCPSALVVLLGAVALGRVGYGLALVIAFSLGLAATLTGLGLVFLYAGKMLERRMATDNAKMKLILRFAPAVGSVALTLAGVAIIIRALGATTFR